MDLIRNKHFIEYVKTVVSTCYQTQKGLSDAQARAIFQDTFYDDFNMLAFILENTYPHTHRDGESYKFITDIMEHHDIANNVKGLVGRMILTIKGDKSYITYENPEFKSGHIDRKGNVTCYNTYRPFAENVTKIGFSGALMDSYNFARVSRYGTVWGGVNTYA